MDKNSSGEIPIGLAAIRRRGAPKQVQGQTGAVLRQQAGPEASPGGKDERVADSMGEIQPREEQDHLPRPAERRAEEYLSQWLRRLGRGSP